MRLRLPFTLGRNRVNTFLKTERQDAVLIVRMDSPATRNALTTPEQMQEFVDVCHAVRRDPSIKVMVLTGNGSSF